MTKGKGSQRLGHQCWRQGLLGLMVVTTLVARLSSLLPLGWPWDLLAHFQLQYWGVVVGAGLGWLGLGWLGLDGLGQRQGGPWRRARDVGHRPISPRVGWGSRRWGMALVGGCLVLQTVATWGGWVWPMSPLPRLNGGMPLRVISSNVHPENTEYVAFRQWVSAQRPDVLVAMEVNQRWLQELRGIEAELPYRVEDLGGTDWGNAIYSRWPLGAIAYPAPRYAIATQIQPEGVTQPLQLIVAHPPPPIRPRLDQIQDWVFGAIAQTVQTSANPSLLIGDLNCTPWSPRYRQLLGQTGLRHARQGRGLPPTWYPRFNRIPALLKPLVQSLVQLPIDHALVSPGLGVNQVWRGPTLGSDHYAIGVDLRLPR